MSNVLSRSRLQAVIDTAVEGIIIINAQGMIQSINPAGERIFGYVHNELLDENVNILMSSIYQNKHNNYISSYLASGISKIIGSGRELVGLRKNGQEFPMRLSIAEFYEDDEQYFAGFISDLSAEKLNLKKARSYEHILEHSLNEIYVFNLDSLKFIHINQGALLNLQYSLEEMLNKTPIDINPEFTDKKFHHVIQPLIDKDIDKLVFASQHQRKDGSTYPVEVHLEITEFGDQKVFVAITLDITEKIAAQEKERINEEQLAHMDRISIFGELAAGIAHEINQPLTAINNYANAGLRRIDANDVDVDKLKKLFVKVDAASQRISDIVTHLRVMLKPKSKKIEHLDMNEVIHDAMDLIKTDSRSADFHFSLQLSSDIQNVLGDSVQFQQVILNLIRNSMDASIDQDAKDNEIIITTEELLEENRIKVSIQDSGCGISPEIEDNLFTPFQTTKETGMGIGLSICQTIIQSHSGRLWHTKNINKGTTFHFTVLTVLDDDHE